ADAEHREASRQFQAGLANQRWAQVLANVLATAQETEALERLELREADPAEGMDGLKRDLAAMFVSLLVPPEQWCGVLSNNEDEAALAFETLKGDAIA
ncbi:HMCN1, partial [Symbiodinium pilosum]